MITHWISHYSLLLQTSVAAGVIGCSIIRAVLSIMKQAFRLALQIDRI